MSTIPRVLTRSLAATLAFASLAACSDFCDNTVVEKLDAPDGSATAMLFERDCGATTGFSTQIAIVPKGKDISDVDAFFVADSNHGAAAADTSWHGPWADFTWSSPTELRVRYDPASRVFKQDDRVGGVVVVFEATSPPS